MEMIQWKKSSDQCDRGDSCWHNMLLWEEGMVQISGERTIHYCSRQREWDKWFELFCKGGIKVVDLESKWVQEENKNRGEKGEQIWSLCVVEELVGSGYLWEIRFQRDS